jgi:circadian clock protein KaiC
MNNTPFAVLEKCPTGITGFDELSEGGLPRARPTLLAGQAGAGKTLFAMGFVLNGIEQIGRAHV